MRVFRILGIDIFIDYSWFLIFALIFWSFTFVQFPAQHPGLSGALYAAVGLSATLLFFASVLFHELSHSIVARLHGVPVHRITLFIFGGVSHLAKESPNPAVEVRIAAAGPAASFLLGLTLIGAAQIGADASPGPWRGMLLHLGVLNVALGIFNLLPGFPLDGGRVLRAISWGRSGNRLEATRTAAAWGKGLGWGLILLGGFMALSGNFLGGLWLVFIGLFLKEAAERERRQAVVGDALEGVTVADTMIPAPSALPGSMSVQEALHGHFLRHGYGGYPVVEEGRPRGVVSLSDLTRCPDHERQTMMVEGIMTALTPDQMTWPGEDLATAMQKMVSAGVSRLPVLERRGDGPIVGLLTQRAIARRVRLREMAGDGPLRDAR